MDNIYSARDIAFVIAKVEDLVIVKNNLEELLHFGTNDERLVNIKRELEKSIRKLKCAVFDADKSIFKEPEIDTELELLKADFDSVLLRYKKRKVQLQALIRSYTNVN